MFCDLRYIRSKNSLAQKTDLGKLILKEVKFLVLLNFTPSLGFSNLENHNKAKVANNFGSFEKPKSKHKLEK